MLAPALLSHCAPTWLTYCPHCHFSPSPLSPEPSSDSPVPQARAQLFNMVRWVPLKRVNIRAGGGLVKTELAFAPSVEGQGGACISNKVLAQA